MSKKNKSCKKLITENQTFNNDLELSESDRIKYLADFFQILIDIDKRTNITKKLDKSIQK